MRKYSWWLAGLCSVGVFAAGDAEDKQVSVTIYNKNLALVEHVRKVNFAAGQQKVEFPGVSAQILPETVSFSAANIELLEQNFDFDLLTPAKLMEKAVGGKVRLVRTNPATGAETSEIAEVLSTTGGTVMRIGPRIEILREDNLPTRVIFDKVPENLRARPTLSVLINSAQARPSRMCALTYLSRGLSWDADYVAIFDEPGGEMALQGWITLSNQSGTALHQCAHATGRRRHQPQRFGRSLVWLSSQHGAAQARAVKAVSRPRVADYYLYPIDQPTTIANNQTKQVSFLESANVKASKGYEITFCGLRLER